MRRPLCAAVTALVIAVGAAGAATNDQWLHIRVEEKGDKRETVRINLPFTLLEGLAPLLHDAKIDSGKVKIGKNELDRDSLRSLWEAVRSAADSEYVTVESEGETVRVAKAGEFLVVRAQEGGEKAEKVDVKMPLSVVDALLSGPDDELNFVAALKALKERGDGELVAVKDRSSTVRIWIDRKNSER